MESEDKPMAVLARKLLSYPRMTSLNNSFIMTFQA